MPESPLDRTETYRAALVSLEPQPGQRVDPPDSHRGQNFLPHFSHLKIRTVPKIVLASLSVEQVIHFGIVGSFGVILSKHSGAGESMA